MIDNVWISSSKFINGNIQPEVQRNNHPQTKVACGIYTGYYAQNEDLQNRVKSVLRPYSHSISAEKRFQSFQPRCTPQCD